MSSSNSSNFKRKKKKEGEKGDSSNDNYDNYNNDRRKEEGTAAARDNDDIDTAITNAIRQFTAYIDTLKSIDLSPNFIADNTLYLNQSELYPVEDSEVISDLILAGSVDHIRNKRILTQLVESACITYHINQFNDDHIAELLNETYTKIRKRLLDEDELKRQDDDLERLRTADTESIRWNVIITTASMTDSEKEEYLRKIKEERQVYREIPFP